MSMRVKFRVFALATGVLFAGVGTLAADDSLSKTLAHVFGISLSPMQLRSDAGEAVAGEIWLVPAAGGDRTRLTKTSGFRSPVFLPDGQALLALRDDALVRIDLPGGQVTELAKVPGVTRLVGVASERPGEVAVVDVSDGQSRIEIVDCSTGRRHVVTHDPEDQRDRLMLAYVEGDEREYGNVRLFTDIQNTSIRQWTDVFIQSAGGPALDITNGNGLSSRQPALSHDGTLVAYVNIGRGH